MMLEQLTLRNFCLFRGKQVFDLTPVQRSGKGRPIILFGGINGGGKTTIFDAIQLALYGQRARCSKRANLAYDDFLLHSIHHGIPPEEGAGVWLSFRYVTDGEPRNYEVRRDWRVQEGKIRESLVVHQDGLPNYSLGRSWAQVVEELIPLEISQLFFFDGEKIRSLAEDETSSEALGTAIKALLGLDIVERLITDANVLQTRLTKQVGTPEFRSQVETIEQECRSLRSAVVAAQTERASLENRLLRAISEKQEVEGIFAASGGKYWEDRENRSRRLGELKSLQEELGFQLVTLAAGELPLTLVPDLLTRVRSQDVQERTAAEAHVVHRLLEERDTLLVQVLERTRARPDVLKAAMEFLAEDRQARCPDPAVQRRLSLSEDAHALLRHLLGSRLAEIAVEAGSLLEKLSRVQEEREELERAKALTPADDDIAQVAERFGNAREGVALLTKEAQELNAVIKARQAALQEAEDKFTRLWQGNVGKEFEREDSERMILLAGRTRDTMQEFLHPPTGPSPRSGRSTARVPS